jgi:signal transduction histidine kinase
MPFRDTPIKRKLTALYLLSTGAVLFLTCSAYFVYEFVTFRQTTRAQLATLGALVAANSTAALAFSNQRDAGEILSALKAEPHIVAAGLYDRQGTLFSTYRPSVSAEVLPPAPDQDGFRFERSYLVGFQPVAQEHNRRLGTLYLKSDLGAVDERLRLYSGIAAGVAVTSLLAGLMISGVLRRQISEPILTLAGTAHAVADRHDYSVRATKRGEDELGLLTDAFNHMLTRIEEQSQERTRAEEHLRALATELARSNTELEQFAYVASHDLQEPLRMVSSYTQLLEQRYGDRLDDDAHDFISYAVDGARRMQQLIHDLLELSRVSTRGKPLVPVDVNRLLDVVRANLVIGLEDAGARVTNDVLPSVLADPTQLGQLLQNLISNAIKFHGNEPPHVHVAARKQQGEWVFAVQDNGLGIEPEYFDRIFVMFQRLHAAADYPGTGIGLAVCKRIVERHGGRIWVESARGRGATFFFTLQPVQNTRAS